MNKYLILASVLFLLGGCVGEEEDTTSNTPTSAEPTNPGTTEPEVDPNAIPFGCVTKDYCPKDFPNTFEGQGDRIKKQINWVEGQTGTGIDILVPDERFDYTHPYFNNITIKRKPIVELPRYITDLTISDEPIDTYKTSKTLFNEHYALHLTIRKKEAEYYEHNFFTYLTCLVFYDKATNTYNYPADLINDSTVENKALTLDMCVEREIGSVMKKIKSNVLGFRKHRLFNVTTLPLLKDTDTRLGEVHKHGQMVVTAIKLIANNVNLKALEYNTVRDAAPDMAFYDAPVLSRSSGNDKRTIDAECGLLSPSNLDEFVGENMDMLQGKYPNYKAELIALKYQMMIEPITYSVVSAIVNYDTLYVQGAGNERQREIFENNERRSFLCASEIKDNVIFAGAVNDKNLITSYSTIAGDKGKDSFLMAPADQHILSQINIETEELEEILPYLVNGGTSFATPIIAASAVLLKERYNQLTGAELKQILLRSADDLGESGIDGVYGYGLLNIGKAYELADKYVTTGFY